MKNNIQERKSILVYIQYAQIYYFGESKVCFVAAVCVFVLIPNTGSSKKMDGIWNRFNLKSTGRIYTFGVLKCSEEFKVLDLP